MPENVLAAVGEKSERLLHAATDNADLCRFFMALASKVALTAAERGLSLDGIRIGAVSMTGTRIIARVTFSNLAIARTTPDVPEADSLLEFIGKEARGLYLLIKKNPDFLVWLQGVIEKMEAHARHKGRKFSEVTFGETKKAGDCAPAFMDADDNVVLDMDP